MELIESNPILGKTVYPSVIIMIVVGILFLFLGFPFRMVRDGFSASIIPPQITYRYDLVFVTITVLVVESTEFTAMASDVFPLWLNPTVLNFLFGCAIGFVLTWLFLMWWSTK